MSYINTTYDRSIDRNIVTVYPLTISFCTYTSSSLIDMAWSGVLTSIFTRRFMEVGNQINTKNLVYCFVNNGARSIALEGRMY